MSEKIKRVKHECLNCDSEFVAAFLEQDYKGVVFCPICGEEVPLTDEEQQEDEK